MTTNKSEPTGGGADATNGCPLTGSVRQPLLLKVDDVVQLLQISRTAVYSLMERGGLPYIKIGASRRIELAAVRKLIDGGRVGA